MPKKKRNSDRRKAPRIPRPRMAQGPVMVLVPCYDPRCDCEPGGVTFSPVPTDVA